MVNVVRSELVRLRRPRLLVTWFGLVALSAVMINMVMFTTVIGGNAPAGGGPGVTFPDVATLMSSDGLVAGLSAAANMFGVVTLSMWAVAVGSDYSTGLIRVLVAAQPRRWRLVTGKMLALLLVTAVSAAVATAVNVVVAPMAAQAAGLSPEAWLDDPVVTVGSAYLNLLAAMCVWGVIGLALAVVLRSSAAAISLGIGYVLVVESIVRMATTTPPSWLIGSTLSALANGGSSAMAYASSVAVSVAYAVIGMAVATVVFTRREVKD